MRTDYERKYHGLEEGQWWFRGRRDMICKILHPCPRQLRILDIGCSTGVLLETLASIGFTDLIGVDVSKEAVKGCRERGHSCRLGDVSSLPFPPGAFDIVISSDVLEHVKDDMVALKEMQRVLRSNGIVIIFVPAHESLWDAHDTVNQHYRRYRLPLLVGSMTKAGFKIVRSSYWNATTLFPKIVMSTLPAGWHEKGHLIRVPEPINSLLFILLRCENALLCHVSSPIGVSCMVIARRPTIKKSYTYNRTPIPWEKQLIPSNTPS